jgi:hypothetical protein
MVSISAVAVIAGLSACGGSSTPAASAKVTKSVTPTPSPTPTLSTAQAASMVRTLYYGESQAYQRSQKQGDLYVLAHDYPGSERRSAYLKCAARYRAQYPGETISEVPEIDTIAPDPTWVGSPRGRGQADWLFAGKSPEGQTYILTIDDIYTYADGQQQTGKYQVHVTIWNGVAYFYESSCPG